MFFSGCTENVASEVHTSQHQGPDMTVSKDSPVADSVQERRPGSTVHLEDNSALEEESSVENDAHVEESEQTCSPRICISTDTMQQPITASSKKVWRRDQHRRSHRVLAWLSGVF